MENYHIAVFDIGKTNKKLLIYDAGLNIIAIEKTKIKEYSHEGLNHDNIPEIEQWMLRCLKDKSSKFNIRVLSVSAHGATFTGVDKQGELASDAQDHRAPRGRGWPEQDRLPESPMVCISADS